MSEASHFERFIIHVSHWWNGCARFNLKHPHWEKADGEFPECSVCGKSGYWIWGYKKFRPDIVAQQIQGGKIDESSAYWAKHDGFDIN